MVANVSSITAAQHKAQTQQNGPAVTSAAAPSFATMLNNEIHANAPAPHVAHATHSTQSASASAAAPGNAHRTGSAAAAKKNSSDTANSGSKPTPADNTKAATPATTATTGTKKMDKPVPAADPAQTDAQTATSAAAAAATAAALAAAASGTAAANATTKKTDATDALATAEAVAVSNDPVVDSNAATTAKTPEQLTTGSDTAQNQMDALVANGADHQGFGQTGIATANTNQKNATINAALAAAASTAASAAASTAASKAPAAPVSGQTAAANLAQMNSLPGKNSTPQPVEFNLNRSEKQETAGNANTPNGAAGTNNSAAAPSTPAAISLPVAPDLSGAVNQLAGEAQQNNNPAGQDLSAQQLNAIAPVVTAPVNLDVAKTPDIAPQVGSPNWDQAVGQKINWMVSGGQSSASLTLNPPELGPMQVVINVNNQHVSASFVSHQPEVRAALENAIPKLREMMGQSGIQLGECNVSSQSRQQDFAQNQSGSGSGSGARTAPLVGSVSVMPSNSAAVPRSGNGLVDTFV